MHYAKIAIGLVLALLIVLLIQCGQPSEKKVELQTNQELAFLNLHDSIKYIGSESCQPCHPDKFDGFMHTGMGKSFAELSPEKSSSFHSQHSYFYDTIKDLHYEVQWIGNRLSIKEFRLFEGDTLYSREEFPDYIIGSGHHTNSHLLFRNGFLFQAPATFYTQKGIWDLPPGFRENNSRFSRRIEAECITCHNAFPTQDTLSFNRYFDIPSGINCERCHGPGSLHVAEKLAGNFNKHKGVYDSSIVNPAYLPWKLQVDLCQRCHLQGNIVLKEGKDFFDFKPGMKLSEIFTVFMPEHSSGQEFKMAAHAERFQMSKCFKQSNKGETDTYNPKLNFTCISCHDPHQSVRLTNVGKFNQTCQSCHNSENQVLCKENPTTLKAKDYNCVSCHMPVSGSEDIPHVTVHDHLISVHKENSNTQEKGKLIGLKSINEAIPEVTTLLNAYISYYEKFDRNTIYLQKAKELIPQLGNSVYEKELKIYYYYTSNAFDEIVNQFKSEEQSSYTNPWTYYRLAKAYENRKDYSRTLKLIQKAIEMKPRFIPFLIDRVIVEIDLAKYNQAQNHINEILKLDAKEERVYSQQARLYFLQDDIQKASTSAQKALRFNPDDAVSIEILTKLSEITGQKPAVLRYWENKNMTK